MKLARSFISFGLVLALAFLSCCSVRATDVLDPSNESSVAKNTDNPPDILTEAGLLVKTVTAATTEEPAIKEETANNKDDEASDEQAACSCKSRLVNESDSSVAQAGQLASKPKRFRVITITLPDDSNQSADVSGQVKEYKVDLTDKPAGRSEDEAETSSPVVQNKSEQKETTASSSAKKSSRKRTESKTKSGDKKRAKRDARKEQSKTKKNGSKQAKEGKRTKAKNAREKQ